MKRLTRNGFTMIELLVVLLIIGILAAVAAPFFLQNADKSKVSEAVAGAGSIRSAERAYFASNNIYLDNASGSPYFGTNGVNAGLLGVTIHAARYFSPDAYSVALGGSFPTPLPNGVSAAQDYVITVTGASSVNSGTDPAPSANDVNGTNAAHAFLVKMDNSGQVIYQTDGTHWFKF